MARAAVEVIHVIPLGDLREHQASQSCWCHPDLDDEGGLEGNIWLHHALDGRESYEEGRALQ